MDQKKLKRILYYGLLGLFAAIFVASAIYLIHQFSVRNRDKDINKDLQNMVGTSASQATDPTGDIGGTGPTQTAPPETQPQILAEYLELYNLNNDMVGWLTIPDTNINYPVMQTPHEPNFYLHRNFYKDYSYGGTLYAWETADINAPSDNITIFGHRMEIPSRDMFFALDKFKTKSYWEEHQFFSFDTLYEKHTYQIIAVFKTHAVTGYPYHRFTDATTEAEFNDFITNIKQISADTFYETGVSAEYGDKIICLSTCEYTVDRDHGRFVVVAKRVS